MPKRLVDIDNDLLNRAQQILGAATMKETVNLALAEVVRREADKGFLEVARRGMFGPGGRA